MRLALPILAIAGAVDAQGLWGNAEVDAYIAANRPRPLTASSDPFATPPITPAPAAHVVLEYRVRGQNEPEGKDSLDPASWTYNPTVGVMRITIKRPPYTGSTAPPMSQGWIVFDEYIRGSSSRATNAYGASVTVTSGVSNTRGIAEVKVDQHDVDRDDSLARCGLQPFVGRNFLRPLGDDEAIHILDLPDVGHIQLASFVQTKTAEHRQQRNPKACIPWTKRATHGVAVSVVTAAGVERRREDRL